MTEPIIIKTTRFGELLFSPEQTVSLPLGMVGLAELRNYVLFQHRADSPFYWLQSIERPDLAFVLVNPLLFEPNYQVTIAKSDRDLLDIKNPKTIQIWVVVTIPHGSPQKMTANLKAPVVLNIENRKMAQIILENAAYEVKHPITGFFTQTGDQEAEKQP